MSRSKLTFNVVQRREQEINLYACNKSALTVGRSRRMRVTVSTTRAEITPSFRGHSAWK